MPHQPSRGVMRRNAARRRKTPHGAQANCPAASGSATVCKLAATDCIPPAGVVAGRAVTTNAAAAGEHEVPDVAAASARSRQGFAVVPKSTGSEMGPALPAEFKPLSKYSRTSLDYTQRVVLAHIPHSRTSVPCGAVLSGLLASWSKASASGVEDSRLESWASHLTCTTDETRPVDT